MPESVPAPPRPSQEAEAEHAVWSRILARVIAGAVHDVRTPLGTMVMKLQLLRDSAGDGAVSGEQLPQHLRVLDAQVERVTEILRRLSGAVEPAAPLGWVDLATLLRDVAGVLGYDARFRGVEVALEPRTCAVRAGGDAEAVGRLVLSVYGRALAGTPRGGRLRARAVTGAEAAILELEGTTGGDPDDGLGYDMEVLAASAAALGGSLTRTREPEIERVTLALPRAGQTTGNGG
jgi:signal transduction histidine kinase